MRMISPCNFGPVRRWRAPSGRPVIEPMERRLLLSAGAIPSNVALTSNSDVQQNPSVAADPLDPRHLVVSYMDRSLVNTGYEGIGVAVSRDGGSTWQSSVVPLPTAFAQGAANPNTVFDGQGHVFISFMSTTFLGARPGLTNPVPTERPLGFQSNNGIFVTQSNDGGLTWNTAIAVASATYNGTDPVPFDIDPNLAIDVYRTLPNGQPNPSFGNMYETFTQLYPPGQFPGEPTSAGGGQVMFSVSSDGGRIWTLRFAQQAVAGAAISVIGPNDFANPGEAPSGVTALTDAQTAIGPEGNVYVDYYMFGYEAVIYSTDAGKDFNSLDLTSGRNLVFNFGLYAGGSVAADSAAGGPQGSGGPTNNFRTVPTRDIIADPTRPGTLYAAEPIVTFNTNGAPLDYGDIFFSKSVDYGVTWTNTFTVGGKPAQVLNDDNGGFPSQGKANDLADAQAIPEMAIDSQGDLTVIWYDTRHDPNDHLLDVYGTVSTDGGNSFIANFRITTQSSDANAGAFIDGEGKLDYFLGDRIGLAVVNGVAYATWTDTRSGSSKIEFAPFSINTPPPAAPDRYGPNDTAASPTNLGPIVERHLARLAVTAGGSEWFSMKAAATGNLTLIATPDSSPGNLLLQLYGVDASTVLATGVGVSGGSGNVSKIVFPGIAGQTYLVRVSADASARVSYSLDLESLTADLGSAVSGTQAGTMSPGDQDLYQFAAGAAGSIIATLTPGSTAIGNLSFEILDPVNTDNLGNPTLIASGHSSGAGQPQQITVPVDKDQRLLLKVSGVSGASGPFTLAFTNPDVFGVGLATNLPFPAGQGPSQVAVADVNNDGIPDLIVTDAFTNAVNVLLGNGNGTFQAPRSYAVGAMTIGNATQSLSQVPTYKRGVAAADLTHNGIVDIVVTNPGSGDVSVLFGRGDGTFAPQLRFDAGPTPNAVVIGDFNGDGIPDLAILSASTGNSVLAILIGRGDGTFLPPQLYTTPLNDTTPVDQITAADLTGNGKLDLIVTGQYTYSYVYVGAGDGTFQLSSGFPGGGPGIAVADLNGDGIPDIAETNIYNSTVQTTLGNGDGTFASRTLYTSGQEPLALAVADIGRAVTAPDGSVSLGPPDGHPDLIVVDSGAPSEDFYGPPEIAVLPSIYDGQTFQGFGPAIQVSAAILPTDLAVADLTGNGHQDVVYVDADGVHVVFPQPIAIASNDTLQTASDLGVVVHVVKPTLSIVPGHEDAYYSLSVPTEAALGSQDEVVDVSANFQATSGAGLTMQVIDSTGRILGSGADVRVSVAQGKALFVHVFAARAADGSLGAGAYTLDIDVLPQLISVEAQPLLPTPGGGGPTSSLVLTFQGDRLDPLAAQDPSNYTITWLDGVTSLNLAPSSIVYDPGANIDVASGLDYPTAVRQTVTLVFADLLPAGSYLVQVSPNVGSQAYNSDEPGLLVAAGASHPLVQLSKNSSVIAEGTSSLIDNLVTGGAAGGFGSWSSGNPSLTQLHDDLSALLDAALTQQSDAPSVSAALLQQIVDRFLPNPAVADSGQPIVAIWLDPVAIDLQDTGARGSHTINYDLHSGSLSSNVSDAYVSVAGNVELLVLPAGAGGGSDSVTLALASVNAGSRGGVVILRNGSVTSTSLTDDIRTGIRTFDLLDYSPAAGLSSSLRSGEEPAIIFDLVQHVSGHSVSDFIPEGGQAASPVQLISEFMAREDEQSTPATPSNESKPAAQPEIYLSPPPAPQAARVTIWEELVGQMRDGFGLLFKFIRDYLAKLPASSPQDGAPDNATPVPSPKAAVDESNPQPTSSVLPMSGQEAEDPAILPAASLRPAGEYGAGDRPRDEVLGAGIGLKWLLLACGLPRPGSRRRR
jgi:hypothetical protein